MNSKKKRIYVSVTNDLCTDQRVSKVCKTLVDNGYEVVLIGRVLPSSWNLDVSYRVKRFKLTFNRGPLFYANYSLRLFLYLLLSKKGVLLSNDLDTLLPNYLISKIKGAKLLYDSHEYFTEVPELVKRPKVRLIWKKIEEFIVPKLHFAYTVSQPIADAYHRAYGVSFKVIRNLPKQYSPELNSQKENIIIYQGALNVGRGLEALILAMNKVNAVLWIAGDGDIAEELKELVRYNNLDNKVSFLGRLNIEELKLETQKARIGISLEEEMGLNYTYALPNKLFDYIQAGVPVLVSALPEMKKVVQFYSIGEVLESREVSAIANQINKMLESASYATWRNNCLIAAKELNWDKESQKLNQLLILIDTQS